MYFIVITCMLMIIIIIILSIITYYAFAIVIITIIIIIITCTCIMFLLLGCYVLCNHSYYDVIHFFLYKCMLLSFSPALRSSLFFSLYSFVHVLIWCCEFCIRDLKILPSTVPTTCKQSHNTIYQCTVHTT